GLDAAVQEYPFEAWGLAGTDLLGLSAETLEALGVRRLGHQELLLEAVEQLRALDAGLASTSLWTLTEKLQELAQGIQGMVLGGAPAGDSPQPPPLALLARVVDLVRAAKELFSWLNRYLFSTLNDFSASQDIVLLCTQLAEALQADCPTAERDIQILRICQHIVGICESIVGCSPPALLDRRAVLQHPGTPCTLLSPPSFPSQGLEITSTSSCLHFVSATTSEALAAHGGHILPGDEIVQVNEQVVVRCLQVGWTRVNLVKKLLEKANGVTLVLKKVPLNLPRSPTSPRQQSPAVGSLRRSRGFRLRGPSPRSAAADLDSGPDSAPDLGTDEEDREDEWPSGLPGLDAQELSGLPGPGVATRLSRRRVSCRDLGRVDCDGWLLKKKDHVGFMAQKWKRCWFVLKGHTLYWYHHPNDEKAAGLINVATYDLESTREQKKKYVFQLSHQRYKPFIFAAETLSDLSMWVSRLITAKTKYALANQSVPDKEEDCYSETEAEDPDDESPRHGCDVVSGPRGHPGKGLDDPLLASCSSLPQPKKRLQNAPEKAQLFLASDSAGEDLECLMRCLKQGGVSLIGQQRFLTQEQCRKSFIRRNKNPHINEKVHAVRALQSTLKAKLAELQALEQLLSDAALTSKKFTCWKEEHQELYQE
ncbi:CNKR1 kinase, partial [Heliornis fulica]|nr:CNKR1 kinase [Heliornis fulica]